MHVMKCAFGSTQSGSDSVAGADACFKICPQAPDPAAHPVELVDKPTPETLSGFFMGKRCIVEIVGPGGAGKTTWLCKWHAGL
jgi:hypothetical protein